MLPPARVLALIAFSPFATLLADEPQLLRIHWQLGKTYTLETLTETTFQKPGDSSPPQSMKVIQTTTLTVRNDPPKTDHLVLVRFASVRGEIGDGKNTTQFDSAKRDGGNAALEEAMSRSVGKSFVLVYDDQDRYRGARELGSLASSPGSVTSLTALADSRDVANLYRKSLEIGLPPIPVSVGQSWTADETMVFSQAGDTHVVMNGKLAGTGERDNHRQARITFEGKLSSVIRKDKPISNVLIGEGSTMSGSVFYDLDRQIPSFSDYANHLNLEVAGQTVPFDQHIISKLVSVEGSK